MHTVECDCGLPVLAANNPITVWQQLEVSNILISGIVVLANRT